MNFKKLALATAIVCVPAAAFSAEVMDDSALAAATGQDGIAIALDLAVTTDTIIHDTNGINAGLQTSYANAGAIVIQGMSVTANGVNVQIDAGDNSASASAPILNVNVNLTGGITLVTGTMGVANSRRDNAAWGVDGAVTNLMSSTSITVGATSLNIQLGATEPQGAMVRINATITGGVTLNNMAVNDAAHSGSIGMSSVTLIDNAGTDLTVDANVDVVNTGGVSGNGGLKIDVNQLGSATGMDVRIVGQYLGTTTAGYVGDIEVQKLDLSGTSIVISGKN